MQTQQQGSKLKAESTLAQRLRDETSSDITQGLRFQLHGWPLQLDSAAKQERAAMMLQRCLDGSRPSQTVVQRRPSSNWNLLTNRA